MPRISRISFVSVGLTDQELLGPSGNRVALQIWPGFAGRVTLNHDIPVALDNGITIQIGGPPLLLTYERDGSVVCEPWRAIAAIAGTIIGIVEVMEG